MLFFTPILFFIYSVLTFFFRLYASDAFTADPSFFKLINANISAKESVLEGTVEDEQKGYEYKCYFLNEHGVSRRSQLGFIFLIQENPQGEGVENLFDNNLETKWVDVKFTDNLGSTLTISCPDAAPLAVRSYEVLFFLFFYIRKCLQLFTANDERARDPTGWTFKGSIDNEHWQTLVFDISCFSLIYFLGCTRQYTYTNFASYIIWSAGFTSYELSRGRWCSFARSSY